MVTIKLAGKDYPMSFSVMATKKISAKYGDVNSFLNSLSNKGLTDVVVLDEFIDILEILIHQGCAYKNYFEKDMPVKDTDPVIEGKWTPLPREALELVIEFADLEDAADALVRCITKDKKGKLEQANTRKNAEAGQE